MKSPLNRNRTTQRDIARMGQVSQATVSRVVSGDERVDHEVRGRILQIMAEQNYLPDFWARSLRKRRTGFIGLVLKRSQEEINGDPFFVSLAYELMAFFGRTQYGLCVEIVTDETQAAVYDEMLRTRVVDGLILVEPEASDNRISRLRKDNFPFVLIGNPHSIGLPIEGAEPLSVDNDNIMAAYEATHHLFSGGYRRVGFLAGPAGLAVTEDRTAGYLKAVFENQATPQVTNSDFGLKAARENAVRLFESIHRPDALVVMDDFMAMGVVQAARSCRLQIPDHLGMVSFNDSTVCDFIECGISSMNLNVQGIVQAAGVTLIRTIEGKPIAGGHRVIIPSRLVERGSSKRPSRKVVHV